MATYTAYHVSLFYSHLPNLNLGPSFNLRAEVHISLTPLKNLCGNTQRVDLVSTFLGKKDARRESAKVTVAYCAQGQRLRELRD